MIDSTRRSTVTAGIAGAALAVISLPVVGETAAFPIRRIYCVGRNYAAHVRELNNNAEEPPFFFQKQRDMIVQNGGKVRYP